MVNPIVIAGCLAIGLGGLAFAFVGGDSRADKRRAAVARTNAKALGASAIVDRTARKKQIADGLRDIEKKGRQRTSLSARIEQAGLSITKQQYLVGSVLFGAFLAVCAYIESNSPLLALLIGVIGIAGLPLLALARLRIRRINKFIANFPTAMDIIVRGIKAGLPLGDTIRIAAAESPEPVKSEFRKRLLAGGARTGLDSVRSLTTVLTQSDRYGTPLGSALRVLSQESRDQRMAAAEKKAAAMPPTLTLPMILFFLPGLFAAILTPAMIQINGWN